MYLYLDVENNKTFLKEKLIENNFTREMKKIKITFDTQNRKILFNYPKREKMIHKNNLWENKIIKRPKKKLLKINLKTEDHIRIGRHILKITNLNNLKNPSENFKKQDPLFLEIKKGLSQIDISRMSKSKSINQTNYLICRICLQKETIKNPFEKNLCKCSKTMPAHLKCLLIWLQKKCVGIKKNDQVTFYDLKKLICDICLIEYPKSVLYKNEKKNIFEVDVDYEKNFIVFESYDVFSCDLIGVYHVEPNNEDEKYFTIGRFSKSLIRLEDNSVSREHCYLNFCDFKWFFIDRESKFGSLKMVTENNLINRESFYNQFIVDKFCIEFHQFGKKRQCPCDSSCKNMKFDDISSNILFNQIDRISQNEENNLKNKNDINLQENNGQINVFINNELQNIGNKSDRQNSQENNLKTEKKSIQLSHFSNILVPEGGSVKLKNSHKKKFPVLSLIPKNENLKNSFDTDFKDLYILTGTNMDNKTRKRFLKNFDFVQNSFDLKNNNIKGGTIQNNIKNNLVTQNNNFSLTNESGLKFSVGTSKNSNLFQF